MLFKDGSRFGSKAGWTAVVVAGLMGTGLFLAGMRQWHSRGTAPTIAPEGKRATARERAQVAASFGNLPLSFEPNQGQTDPEVKFLSRSPRYELFLTANEAVFTLPMPEPAKGTLASPLVNSARRHQHAETVLRMKMRGANRRPNILGDVQLAARITSLGATPASGRATCHSSPTSSITTFTPASTSPSTGSNDSSSLTSL